MKKLMLLSSFVVIALFVVACDFKSSTADKVIKSAPAGNNLTVSLATADGLLRHGDADFTVSFIDASGKPIDVGTLAMMFHMPQMGSMPAMNAAATFTTTGTPGTYNGKARIEMAGDWQAQVAYEGRAGKGKTSFPVTVR